MNGKIAAFFINFYMFFLLFFLFLFLSQFGLKDLIITDEQVFIFLLHFGFNQLYCLGFIHFYVIFVLMISSMFFFKFDTRKFYLFR